MLAIVQKWSCQDTITVLPTIPILGEISPPPLPLDLRLVPLNRFQTLAGLQLFEWSLQYVLALYVFLRIFFSLIFNDFRNDNEVAKYCWCIDIIYYFSGDQEFLKYVLLYSFVTMRSKRTFSGSRRDSHFLNWVCIVTCSWHTILIILMANYNI